LFLKLETHFFSLSCCVLLAEGIKLGLRPNPWAWHFSTSGETFYQAGLAAIAKFTDASDSSALYSHSSRIEATPP